MDVDDLVKKARGELLKLGMIKLSLSDGTVIGAEALDPVSELFLSFLDRVVMQNFKEPVTQPQVELSVGLLGKLLKGEILSPRTADEEEWQVHRESPPGVWTNRRFPRVYRVQVAEKKFEYYDSEFYLFKDEDGTLYVSADSNQEVAMPYTPRQVIQPYFGGQSNVE